MSYLKELCEVLTKPKQAIQEQRAQIREWLAPIVTDGAQKKAFNLRHGTTCDWFLASPKFEKWSQYDSKVSKILWIHAPAGFGKSVLCARVIDHMQGDSSNYGRVLFFYCSGEDSARRHPFAILKSWIWQLVARVDEAVGTVMKDEQAQQNINDGSIASEAEQDYLWSLLSKLMTQSSHWTLVIDGYDECLDVHTKISKYDTEPCRAHFLQRLSETIRGTGIRVLLVSRNQPDIDTALKESCVNPERLELIEQGVTKEDTKQDLSSYSQTIFENKIGKNKTLSAMADEAVEKSDGMFLWIYLIDKKLGKGATTRRVKDLVKKTPREIYGAYRAELDKILDPNGDNTARAVVILKWILYAARPLTVREMTEALAVTFNEEPPTYPHEDLPSDFAEAAVSEEYVQNYIRMPCGSLIELRKAYEDTPMEACTIHFVHFSVKEYLQQNPSRVPTSNRTLCFGAETTEHNWVASLCLQYMCYDEFDDAAQTGVASMSTFSRTYPFFSYTAANWHDHYLRGEGSDSRAETSEILWGLFSTQNWRIWAEMFERHLHETSRDATGTLRRPGAGKRADSGYESLEIPEADTSDMSDGEGSVSGSDREDSGTESEDEKSKVSDFAKKDEISPNPVYYAAMLGLTEVLQRLIDRNPSGCSLGGGELGNPLQAAVVNGEGAAVKILLKHKANPSETGGRYGTPLIAAVVLGSNDIFGQLVDACGELDAVDGDGKTALYHACALGSLDMVRRLIEAGADMNLKPKSGRSPLVRAITRDHLKVVEFLLKSGVNVNERIRNNETPLLLAVESRGEPMVQLLLEHHADPCLSNRWGLTALHVACYEGSAALTRLLLKQSTIKVDKTDNFGWTPLHYAAQTDSKAVAELLLAHGASPLGKEGGTDIMTPCGVAAQECSKDVIELFSKQETIRANDAAVSELFAAALDTGDASLVDSLLKSSIRSGLSVDDVRDILELAIRSDREDLFNTLVECIQKPKTSDTDLTSLPDRVVLWSDDEEHTIATMSWGTDTQKAMALDTIWRSYTAARDIVPDAILPIAVANRALDVVTLLLQRGADVYRQIRFSGAAAWSRFSSSSSPMSPLLMAVYQNSRELVALMLEKGQRPAADKSGIALLTALESAGNRGGMSRTDLTRMLIAHGALDADADTDSIGKGNATVPEHDDAVPKEEGNDSGIEDDLSEDAGTDTQVSAPRDDENRDLEWWQNALVGEWEGHYTYDYGVSRPDYKEPTSFKVDEASNKSLSMLKKDVTLFEGCGTDEVAKFDIHGQVKSGRTVRFVKLYPSHGWMYEGMVEETETGGWRMKGQWGSRFGASNGDFVLTKKLPI